VLAGCFPERSEAKLSLGQVCVSETEVCACNIPFSSIWCKHRAACRCIKGTGLGQGAAGHGEASSLTTASSISTDSGLRMSDKAMDIAIIAGELGKAQGRTGLGICWERGRTGPRPVVSCPQRGFEGGM
jgi:hypothetical protein